MAEASPPTNAVTDDKATVDTLTIGTATLDGTLEIRSTTGDAALLKPANSYLELTNVTGVFDTFVGLDRGSGAYVALSRSGTAPEVRSLVAARLPRRCSC